MSTTKKAVAKKSAPAKMAVAKKAEPEKKSSAKKEVSAKKTTPKKEAPAKAVVAKGSKAVKPTKTVKEVKVAVKPVAKTSAKAPAKKSAPKKVEKKVEAKETSKAKAEVKKVPTKKSQPSKEASKASTKAPSKVAAKPATKVDTKEVAKKSDSKKSAPALKKGAKKVEPEKKPSGKKETTKKQTKQPEAVELKAQPPKEMKKIPSTKTAKTKTPKEVGKQPVEEHTGTDKTPPKESKGKSKHSVIHSVLLEDGKKRPVKNIMFFEINEEEEKINQKKVSSELKLLDKKPTVSIRQKMSIAEETQEELTERILKELDRENMVFSRESATQTCIRCNNLISPEFWVDKHLAYCEECAFILKLGQSKEARKVDYQMGALGGDSLDEADDDFEGPSAADLADTEDDLEDL